MATSGYDSSYYDSGFGVDISIEWNQFNFNPQNESFDLKYNIKIKYTQLITNMEFARNFSLTFKYKYENKTVVVINNKTINIPSYSSFPYINVASGIITIKSADLSELKRILNTECIVTYQLGYKEVLTDNINWKQYSTSTLSSLLELDGFSSPYIYKPETQKIVINSNDCDTGTITFNVKEAYTGLKYKTIIKFKTFTEIITNNETINGVIYYTPSSHWLELMPNIIRTSEPEIIITAYNNNGKQIGDTNKLHINIEISESVKPSIGDLELEKISEIVPKEWDSLIQYNSKARISLKDVLPGKGSTIQEYCIIDNIGNISHEDFLITGILLKSGLLEFNAYVVDTRGRKSDIKTFSINVEPYSYPSIIEYYAKRCNNNMELIDNGENILAKMNASYSLCNYKNAITELSVDVKNSINNELISIDNITLNEEKLLSGLYDPEFTFVVTFTVSDCLHTSKVSLLVSTSNTTLDLKRGGTGIAFGKVSELDGFECEFDAYFNNNVYLTIDGIKKEIRELIKEVNNQKISLDKIIKSTEITEDGYLIDGKYLSNILFNMNKTIEENNYIIEFGEGTILTESHKTPSNITISTGNTTINLNKPFTSTPYIFLTNNNSIISEINASGITCNSFNVFGNYELTSQNGTINFNWLAIQKV